MSVSVFLLCMACEVCMCMVYRMVPKKVVSKTPVHQVEQSQASITVLIGYKCVCVVMMVLWSCHVGQDFWILPHMFCHSID